MRKGTLEEIRLLEEKLKGASPPACAKLTKKLVRRKDAFFR